MSRSTKFGVKLGEEGSKLYKRASECHPYIKDHMKPRVEGVFTTFPLNICCWALTCGLPCDLCLWSIPCFNCCCTIPFDLCITIPYNTLWMVVLASFILTLAGLQFILSLFGFTITFLPGVGGFGIF